jgi:hypothetical protein
MADKHSVRVFISYARKDRPWVQEFTAGLREAGLDTYFDIADLSPGEPWQDRLESALRASEAFVFVLSPDSVVSPSTLLELGAAIGGDKRIIPVATGDLNWKDVPEVLLRYQFLTERSAKEAGRRVAQTLAVAA